MFSNTGAFAEPAGAQAIATAAEETGFESLWTVEHVLVPQGYESTYPYDPSGKMPGGETFAIPDPLVWLSYVAGITSTIKLATGILILPQRNPAVVAKEVATLDKLAGGRMILGVGAGWLREEFDALGVPFDDRGKRLDSYVGALRALWDDEPATCSDEFLSLDKAISLPNPPRGSVPIVVGGHSEAAARRAGRIGDGFFPGRGGHERLASLISVMRQAAEEAGRDPDEIEITAGTLEVFGDDPLGAVGKIAELGVDRIVIPPLAFDPAAVREAFTGFAERVLDRL